jgi:2-aminobenzoate-CoA ligase
MLAPSAHVDTFTRDNLPPAHLWPPLIFKHPDVRYPQRLNCAVELLDRTIAGHGPDRRCLVDADGTAWTYADLLRHTNQIAHVLVDDIRLVPGNRVLLRAPNSPWLVAWWLAVLRMGGVVVTTMPQLRRTEIATVHQIARVNHSIVDDELIDDLVAADIGRYTSDTELRERAARKPTDFPALDTAADDVALLAFTSGTTGRPKATMHFHRDVLANADTFSRHVLRPRPDDLFTGSPPLGFTFGLGGLVVFPLRAGAASLLLPRGTPDALLPAIARHRPTVLFTAPTAYRAILHGLAGHDVSSLRRCVSAGEPLPLSTWDTFHRATGLRIIDGIGSTEMLHIFISAADDDIRPGATGLPVPGYEAAVLDGAGKPVPDGELGRLAVRGPTGCRYLADERQDEYVRYGWNLTGDTYIRDGDGYFWYQARDDDMIISAGYNIAGPEVEMALLRHRDVRECGVVGAPDPERTMVVKAFVVLETGVTGGAAKVHELQEHCRREIASYKMPRAIEFVPELPRTSTGKLQRFRLREMAMLTSARLTSASAGTAARSAP